MPIKDLTLTGELQQDRILTAGRITVAAEARFQGELVACNVEIAGMVLGNILASHTCRLRPTAKVAGNILCRHLIIDPGALLEGQVELVREADRNLP
jgi:cytoskeletal protein CcmA (bactofilin family)